MRLQRILLTTLVSTGAAGLAMADRYDCEYTDKQTQQDVRTTVEASSREEALYKTSERATAGKRGRQHICRSAAEVSDVFLSDLRFKNNSHLRPYLPADVKLSGGRSFQCTSSGDFLPDKSPDSARGTCIEAMSSATGTTWRIRNRCSGYMSEVWKKEGAGWKPWVSFTRGDCTDHRPATASITPEAQSFAATRRPSATTTTTTAPAGNQESSQKPVDTAKKGLDELLKAFKR